jgi:hypothetical protein
MDGGVKQEEKVKQLKREIKEKARQRRGGSTIQISGDQVSVIEATPGDLVFNPSNILRTLATSRCNLLNVSLDLHNNEVGTSHNEPGVALQLRTQCTLTGKDAYNETPFIRSDTVLITFYLEHLLPFLFPFYCPSLLEGGRAWILEMMLSSPVIRQATLCQSSYFFSLARGTTTPDTAWDEVLIHTTEAFGLLRRALQVIDGSNISEHLNGAVRIMASIMQMHCFEVAVLRFRNWQTHLNAAIVIFKQILDSVGKSQEHSASFDAVMDRLGPSSPSWSHPSPSDQIPSAEQAAFRFSSALVIFNDVIASTTLQEQPRLYDYHRSLLGGVDCTVNPAIDLEAVLGLKNWTLLQIGEIAVLEAWKQRFKTAGSLDVVQLAQRATCIKSSLVAHLTQLEHDPETVPKEGTRLLSIFTSSPSQTFLVSRIWAHAALIYLYIVASGWQPTNIDVLHHVSRVLELLEGQTSSALLRTMVWPFCIAGCFADSAQEVRFRGLVEVLQPPSMFDSAHKALEIMEKVWRDRDGENVNRDFASYFRVQGEVVLLV